MARYPHHWYGNGSTRARAAAVLLHDPDRDCVVLVEQFRIGAVEDTHSAWLMECPAGMIEPGEQPKDVALRECLEEVGRQPVTLPADWRILRLPGRQLGENHPLLRSD